MTLGLLSYRIIPTIGNLKFWLLFAMSSIAGTLGTLTEYYYNYAILLFVESQKTKLAQNQIHSFNGILCFHILFFLLSHIFRTFVCVCVCVCNACVLRLRNIFFLFEKCEKKKLKQTLKT